jgi:hypothetical protein
VKPILRALYLIFVAVDQLLNVLSNPFSSETWPDETLSARCGRLGHRNPYKFWKAVIDWVFERILRQGPNHCVLAHEKEKTRYHSPPAGRLSKGVEQ